TENRLPFPRAVSGAAVSAQVDRDDAEPRGQFPGQLLHAHQVRAGAVKEQEWGTGSAEVAYRDVSAENEILRTGHDGSFRDVPARGWPGRARTRRCPRLGGGALACGAQQGRERPAG